MNMIKMDILFYKKIVILMMFILLPLKSNEYSFLESIIFNIENTYVDINRKNSFSKRIKINDINFDLSLEGKKLYQLAIVNMNKFYYKDNIQKISLYFDTRDSDIVSEYYYKNNNLFFLEQSIYSYQSMKDSDKFNKNQYIKFRNKFYFHKNKMIFWKENGKEMSLSLLKEKEIISDSKLYLTIRVKIINGVYKSLYSFCQTTGIKESEIRALNPWINKKATNIPPNAEIIIPNINKEENNESK